jgi:hypothetical protein
MDNNGAVGPYTGGGSSSNRGSSINNNIGSSELSEHVDRSTGGYTPYNPSVNQDSRSNQEMSLVTPTLITDNSTLVTDNSNSTEGELIDASERVKS